MDVCSLYCFHIHKDYYHNINYYFIDAKESKDPDYFYYSNGSVPIGVNFRDDRTKKVGLVKRKETFGNHLNYETELKFGPSIKGKIIQYLMATLTFPIWLPILIGFKINELRKRF